LYLYLVRHGLSTGNVARFLQGWMDTDLTPEGEEQARKTAEFFAHYGRRHGLNFTALYSSPLKRAYDTARAIGRELKLKPIADPSLREMHGGQVEGKTLEEWQSAFPGLRTKWENRADMSFGWPGGETRAAFRDRAVGTIRGIVERHDPLDNVIVVTHGGVIRAYLNHAGLDNPAGLREFSAGNCSITHVRYDHEGTWIGCLVDFNQQAHLEDVYDVAEAANPDLALL
jgi:broad specificity phosphatase PhoE